MHLSRNVNANQKFHSIIAVKIKSLVRIVRENELDLYWHR